MYWAGFFSLTDTYSSTDLAFGQHFRRKTTWIISWEFSQIKSVTCLPKKTDFYLFWTVMRNNKELLLPCHDYHSYKLRLSGISRGCEATRREFFCFKKLSDRGWDIGIGRVHFFRASKGQNDLVGRNRFWKILVKYSMDCEDQKKYFKERITNKDLGCPFKG